VSLIGRHIESTYGVASGVFIDTDYIDGVCYITDPNVGLVFCLDFVRSLWRMEKVGHGGVETPAVLFSYGDTQYYGPQAGIEGSLVNYRTFPAPARTKDFDDLPMDFLVQTGDFSLTGARRPVTPRNLYMQVRQRGGTELSPGFEVTPVFDGVTDPEPCDVDASDPGVRRLLAPGFGKGRTGAGINTFGIRMEQHLLSGDESVVDIEDVYVDLIVESPRA